MNTTPAQKKAHAEFERRLKEAGGSKITLRLDPAPTKRLAEIAAALGSRDKAIAAAIMAYRTAPPVQDTKTGPVADYEGKQAERRSRERPKTLSATLPAGDPVKAASEPQKRLSVDVQIGPTKRKPGEMLKTPKGGKR